MGKKCCVPECKSGYASKKPPEGKGEYSSKSTSIILEIGFFAVYK